jgi:hypothetical protein
LSHGFLSFILSLFLASFIYLPFPACVLIDRFFSKPCGTMYPHPGAPMPPPPTQKPETFMLSQEAQNSLPHDAQVALQQVDNCTSYVDSTLTETP